MIKRLLLLVFVICLTLILVLCTSDESSTIMTLDEGGNAVSIVESTSPNLVSVFSTRDDKEYLTFLTQIGDKYEIIDITTSMRTHRSGESYVVTYKAKEDNSNSENVSYQYYLYKTRKRSEYISFYSSFNFETYQIVDISTQLSSYREGESYIITYRKAV